MSIPIEVFGGKLQEQNAGFYVTLELLAMVWGTLECTGQALPDDLDTPLRFQRRTHDFARRLVSDPTKLSERDRSILQGGHTLDTLRGLLTALTVPTPGRRSTDNWRTTHFLPYVGDLVHYEGVLRGEHRSPEVWQDDDRRPLIQQNLYRGGGALAHRILRTDPDSTRLGETRRGLELLMQSSRSALGRVAKTLQSHDRSPASEGRAETEHELKVHETRWTHALRSGVHRIVARGIDEPGVQPLARSRRVDALLYWVPFCIAMHQLERAHEVVRGMPYPGLVVFCGSGPSPLKTHATEEATRSVNMIYEALTRAAKNGGDESFLATKSHRTSPRRFFSVTLGRIGFLSSLTGTRHFTLKPELLEALVIAQVGEELKFEDFCYGVLYRRLGLIVDPRSAESNNLLRSADRSAFDSNAAGLLESLRDLGLVREFSDATRMVTPEVL